MSKEDFKQTIMTSVASSDRQWSVHATCFDKDLDPEMLLPLFSDSKVLNGSP